MATSKISDLIQRRYQKTKELTQDAFDKVEVNKNLYKGILNVDDTYEWDYSLVDPHVFPLVRNYLSRSNPTMSAIRLDVRRDTDYDVRQVNQDFLNWEIGELMMTSLYYRTYFSAYLAGHGYNKTGWKYEKAIEIQEKDDAGNVTRVKVLRDITNRAESKFVRFNNLLIPDRNNPVLFEQPYILETMQMRVGAMLDENKYLLDHGDKAYWSEKFLAKLKKSGVTGKLLEYEMARAEDGDSKDDIAFRSAVVPLVCMQTIDGGLYYKPLVDGEDTINNDEENRYWHGHYPYIDFCPFPEDDEFYNLALVDVVGDLQIAATEVLNQTLTNIRQINNDMWIVGSGGAQTPDWQFRKRPDGVIRVMGDNSQVTQIRTQDNTRSAMLMGDALGTKIEKAGGIGSLYSSGAASGTGINQTARGAQIIDQNIDTNMKMIIDLFGEQVLKPTGEHFLELNAQYVTEDQTFSVTGKRGVRQLMSITPDQVNANFIVSVNTEKIQKQTPASRQASLQNTLTVLQDVETKSQGSLQMDLVPVVEALIDATPEMDDVTDIVITIDEKADRDAKMLERGQMPEIKIRDPHEDLIVAVNVKFPNVETMAPEAQKMLEDYVNKHMQYIQSAKEVQMMKQPVVPQGAPAGNLVDAMNPEVADPNNQAGAPNPTYNLQGIV
jgi:hypothetical protein